MISVIFCSKMKDGYLTRDLNLFLNERRWPTMLRSLYASQEKLDGTGKATGSVFNWRCSHSSKSAGSRPAKAPLTVIKKPFRDYSRKHFTAVLPKLHSDGRAWQKKKFARSEYMKHFCSYRVSGRESVTVLQCRCCSLLYLDSFALDSHQSYSFCVQTTLQLKTDIFLWLIFRTIYIGCSCHCRCLWVRAMIRVSRENRIPSPSDTSADSSSRFRVVCEGASAAPHCQSVVLS